MSLDGLNRDCFCSVNLHFVVVVMICCIASGCMSYKVECSLNVRNHELSASVHPGGDVPYPANRFGSEQAIKAQLDLSSKYPISIVTKNAHIELRLVPMSTNSNGQLRTTMRGLYVAKYETTQRQWDAILGNSTGTNFGNKYDLPVVNISLLDIQVFLKTLNEVEGVPPGTYRLPTREEWQIACKAGLETDTYAGDLAPNPEGFSQQADLVAWYIWNTPVENIPGRLIELRRASELEKIMDISCIGARQESSLWDGGPKPVGFKLPNAYGLYDMLGNAAELALRDNGEVKAPPYVMGGGWKGYAGDITWKIGGTTEITERNSYIGFRIVKSITD